MRILFLYGGNNGMIPYVYDQGNALKKLGLDIIYLSINGNGIRGYLNNLLPLKKMLIKKKIDIVHAHYGYSGLLANLQRKVPVVTTFHGSDINIKKNRKLSKIAHTLSKHSIFVSRDLQEKLNVKLHFSIIPCGVDISLFTDNYSNQKTLNDGLKILFSSSFDREVKNYPLARDAIELLQEKFDKKIEVIELKNYSREEVAKLMNNVDVGLLTSYSEGSPQFVKELMAINCPCVATNVGDIEWLFGNTSGYFITTFEPEDVADNLYKAIKYSQKHKRTVGRKRIIDLGLNEQKIAQNLHIIYRSILNTL